MDNENLTLKGSSPHDIKLLDVNGNNIFKQLRVRSIDVRIRHDEVISMTMECIVINLDLDIEERNIKKHDVIIYPYKKSFLKMMYQNLKDTFPFLF